MFFTVSINDKGTPLFIESGLGGKCNANQSMVLLTAIFHRYFNDPKSDFISTLRSIPRISPELQEIYKEFADSMLAVLDKPVWLDHAVKVYNSGRFNGNTVKCIKFIREQTGLGLKEAKELFDENIKGRY